MRIFHWCGFCLLTFVIAIASLGAGAQNAAAKPPKEFTVGISLDSNYARITDFLPALRDSLLKDIPGRRKQIRVVAVDGLPQNAADAAKSKGCDYLLQLSVLEMSGAGIGFNTRQPSSGISPEPNISPWEERERRELQWVRFDYRLQSLKDDRLNVEDSDYVRYGEYPAGWNPSAFETTTIRAATRVALASLNKLPKK